MNTTYYISTGAQHKMYTLRMAWISPATMVSDEKMYDCYVQNLSTDEAKAEAKAQELTGLSVESLVGNLQAIQRRTAQEMQEARDRAEIAEAEVQAHRYNTMLDAVLRQVWPYGKYTGQPLSEAPDDYAVFMYSVLTAPEDKPLRTALYVAFGAPIERAANFKAMAAGNGEHYGTVKQRFDKVQCVVVERFGFMGFYGWVDITKYVTPCGALLVHKGKGKPCEVGDTVVLVATVKSHGDYNGVEQTEIIRPAHK